MLRRDARLVEEPISPMELRTPFQRDRDRILYTSQLRRLGGITQITSPDEPQAFHNRLTHTLEVAQIARRIAERAVLTLPEAAGCIDPDVCEAAALAHDLGHPPFGHNGEDVLDELSRELDPDGFEANAQSFRILVRLAVRAGDQRGLNLTAATLRASLKYPWLRKPGIRKFGVYKSEAYELEQLATGGEQDAPGLEAQIMDWADDVAYSTHDFLDFVLAGFIPLRDLREMDDYDVRCQLGRPGAPPHASGDRALSFIAGSLRDLPKDASMGALKRWVSNMITRFAAERIRFVSEDGVVRFVREPEVVEEVAVLKALTYRYAIGSFALSKSRVQERDILTKVYGSLMAEYESVRDVLDFISGLTDAQAVEHARRLD